MARRRIEVDVARAEELARKGLSDEQIRNALGVSERTFYRRKNELAVLAEALTRARARAEGDVADKLMALMDDDGTPPKVRFLAMTWWLERRAGWTLAAMDKKLMGDALTHEVPTISVQIDTPNEHTPAWAELREKWRREWERELAEKQDAEKQEEEA